MLFWDSSAVVPLLIAGDRSRDCELLLDEDPSMVVWWGTVVECLSSIARVERSGGLPRAGADLSRESLAVLRESWSEVEASEAVRNRATTLLLRHPLRAADALQLGAGLRWAAGEPERLGFVTLDTGLAEAARLEGFELLL